MIRSASFAPSVAAFAVALVGASLFVARTNAADDPREVAFGTFEILNTELRRVDTLLGQTFDDIYPRFDAPDGMTFLSLRWTLKPTFQPAEPFPMASIPHKQVYVETESGKTAAIGRCDADGTFHESWASLLAVDHENHPDVYSYSAVFLVPETAKRAKFLVAKMEVEEPLEGEILPRLDWRDGLDVEVLKVEMLPEAKRLEGEYDSVSGIAYELTYEFQSRSNAMLAVSLRIAPKRADRSSRESPFSMMATDLRVARGDAPALLPVGRHYGSGFARLDQPALFAETSDDGKLLPIEATLVYGLQGPIEKATILFRNAPLGEFEVQPGQPIERK